ncbi:hypothetical protein [Amycolatopsis sp. SID8362]|uniref:hypothetical protein n=1 Tax=Amycolatopsis sp. SID8362 TaxID=2690346 RepID=UPI0013715453|nr:hypothetical protein [Amycolatopsis sp. SID8362]NBH06047.1 hypothetical protein [Amycolatopsis sp. SID8362]NED42746.1 hypothetical protein [Amycolatopsis sp. SID8362]
MTIIVKGHGWAPDEDLTFVPIGQTVRTYTADTVALSSNIALFALLDGAGQPGRKITGPIRNYQLGRQDDEFVAKWTALAGDSGVEILWVGTNLPDGIRMCGHDNPHGATRLCDEAGKHICLDGTTQEHAFPRKVMEPSCEGMRRHICSGVLGRLSPDWVEDIALVACLGEAPTIPVRGLLGSRRGNSHNDSGKPDLHVDTEYDFTRAQFEGIPPRRNLATSSAAADLAGVVPVNPDDSPTAYVVRRISKQPADLVAIAEAEAYVDRLPQATMSLLINDNRISSWLRARWIKIYAEQGELDQMVGQLASNIPRLDAIMEWLTKVPWYGDALDRACVGDEDRLVHEVDKFDEDIAFRLKDAIGRRFKTRFGTVQAGQEFAARTRLGSAKWLTPDSRVAEDVYQSVRSGDLYSVFVLLGVRGKEAGEVEGVLDHLVTKPGYGEALDAAAQQNPAQFWELFGYSEVAVQVGLLGRVVLRELIDQHLWTLLTSGDTLQTEADVDALPDQTRQTLYANSGWLGPWQRVRVIAYHAGQDEIEQLFQLLRDNIGDFDMILELINTIPVYRQALDDTAGRNADAFAAQLELVDETIGGKLRENFSWII